MIFPKNVIDITGKKFGQFKAVQFLGCKKPYGALWEFMCICGKVQTKSAGRIISGGTRSCGCARRRLPLEQAVRMSYSTHVKAAKARGIQTDLTITEWRAIAVKPCLFCGDISTRKNKRFGEVKLNSVDRLNNERFYKKENSVPSCIQCNMMKNSYRADEFIDHAKKIARMNGGA